MAGLIAKLWKRSPADPFDPALGGMGGARQGPGPAGTSGVPGTTSVTRTFHGRSPRDVKINADSDVGFNQGLDGVDIRQESRAHSSGQRNPRDTPEVVTPRPKAIADLRRSPREWFGGLPLRSDAVSPGTHAAGGGLNPLMPARMRAATPPMTPKPPGPAASRTSAAACRGRRTCGTRSRSGGRTRPARCTSTWPPRRPDQGPGGLAGQGAGGGRRNLGSPVSVPSRYVWDQGGVQTWSVQRQMPYGGKGDGARGASLNGTRYYAEGPPIAVNAALGSYGVSRLRGPRHRPVYFNEPAPWTSQFYDTTASWGPRTSRGQAGRPPMPFTPQPDPGRGGMNSTGR